MPKVIKGDALPNSAAPATAALVDRKVIDRAVFTAQQRADEVRRAAEQWAAERRARGEDEKQAAYQNAHRVGNLAALAEIGALAVDGYFQRAQQLRQAVDDCLLISRHICSKILGRPPKVAEAEERRIASEALLQAVQKQRLLIGVSVHDYAALERSEPKLVAALAEASEFRLECQAQTTDGSATLRAGDREFVAPLAPVLDRLCKVLILPRVKLQFASADPAVEPAAPAEADSSLDEGVADFSALEEAGPSDAAVNLPVGGEFEEAAEEAGAGDASDASTDLVEDEPAADATAAPRRRDESVGMHDISRLVAAIDAEDEDT